MKKIFSITAPIAFLLALVGWRVIPESAGAPVSSTGAPGEVNCTTSGCHDDTTPNIGSAKTGLRIEGEPEYYTPGKSYELTVQISDPEKVRFGYQLVALTGEGKNAGDLSLIDEERTQIIQNELELKDRKYATYTYSGTQALENGRNEWKIRWTAPKENSGDVTFYLATVSANNDYTDKGDQVYTMSRQLAAPQVSAISAHENSSDYLRVISVGNNFVEVANKFSSPQKFSAAVTDMNGKNFSLGEVEFSSNVGRNRIATPELSRGAYLLSLHNSARTITQKFIVE